MATHSSTLAWKIPWMEEPGRLQFMGLQGVGHNWATSLTSLTHIVKNRNHMIISIGLEKKNWQNSTPFHNKILNKLEVEGITHSSVLAWRIPGTGEPVGPPSMGSHRVEHDWSDLAASAAAEGITSAWIQSGSSSGRYEESYHMI